MGLYDETKKFEEVKDGIHATFNEIDNGINIRCSVNASQQEIEILIISLIGTIADRQKVHTSQVVMDITMQMMARDLGGKE